jgi:hypothetical protein
MEYYSALKRDGLSNHEKILRNLNCILLSKRSQSEKTENCMIPAVCHSGKGQSIKTVKGPVLGVLREAGMNRQSTEDFFRAVKLFYEIL